MKPKILAVAKFDRNMVATLEQYFDDYATDGVVQIEVTDHGLWLVNPNQTRQFLGSTEVLPNTALKN